MQTMFKLRLAGLIILAPLCRKTLMLQHSVEAIPWVAHAIRKQWPDTVKVFLTEHRPVAIWTW